jgi:hypothetical protein
MSTKFPRGKAIDRFDYDFEGQRFETGSTRYHCDQISAWTGSLFELLVHWLASRSLGSTEALYVASAVSAG